MHGIRKLAADLQRLRCVGGASIKINGMDASDQIETLANAILDLDARLTRLERGAERRGLIKDDRR